MSEQKQLVDYFTSQFKSDRAYQSIVEARQDAAAILGQRVEPGTALAKLVDESVESGVVRAARAAINTTKTPTETYNRLLGLHDRQPNLSVRSSTSVREQAYSTPLPIAYLASTLAGINEKTTVYEPTAGHGALLLSANPANVTVNELNPDRAADLIAQGFTVTQHDASTFKPAKQHDVVIANPPFGRVKDENNKTRRFDLPGNRKGTTQIDQAIALQSLQSMKDEGRAVLILGSKPGRDEAERSESFNTLESRGFFFALYDQYNVTQHITISGDLYRKQGAAWPLDVIVIEGRGKSSLPLPAAQVPKIYTSFEELREVLNNAVYKNIGLQRLPELRERLDSERGSGSESVSSENSIRDENDDVRNVPKSDELPDRMDASGGVENSRKYQGKPSSSNGADTPGAEPSTGSTDLVGGGRGNEADLDVGIGLGNQSSGIQRNLDAMVSNDQSRSDISSESGQSAGIDGSSRRNNNQSVFDGTESKFRVNISHETEEEVKVSQEFNTPYKPRSQGRSPGTLIPTNMAVSAQQALERIEQQHGNLDEFVMQRLGMNSKAELWEVLYAEQIDSLALSFDQLSKGKIFLNGDQTGNGKGRFGAASIIDAQRQGYIPVFVTQKPNLYSSMLTDLSDIGRPAMLPFMTNNDLTLKVEDGRKLQTGSALDQELEMTRISRQGLGGYDVVFTTYDQLQTVSGKEPFRRSFMRSIADKAIFIFDEAHEAGGASSSQDWTRKNEAKNRSEFVRELVDRSAGAIFMSATATKNPAVMDLYARRTDAVHAVASMENLEQTLKAGGIPLQQMMATKFVSSGHLLRRERSFESISFDAKVVSVDRAVADGISGIMRAIDRFDRAKSGAIKDLAKELKNEAKKVSEDNSIGQAGVKSTNFTSLMHNSIEQGLLCQKAEATVQEAIAALERGEKPLIALASTMDAFIKDFADDRGIDPGESVEITFSDVLNRYLERSRDIVVSDHTGNLNRRPMTQDEMGADAFDAFIEAKAVIARTDLSAIPISSIDYIRARLTQEGYRVDEITGRKNTIEYGADGSTIYKVRPGSETSPQGKINIVNRFNDGSLDVVILNRSGATGINLHASEKFKDQKPRHMIVVQAERDINQVMQMLGRANRFGQVVEPKFTLLMGDVPAEKRLGALLVKKMASLNANTTAARNSDMSVSNVTDFMNAAGEEVVTELLKDNPELDEMLSYPLSGAQGNSDIDLISRVTGRIPLLPLNEQEELYQLIESETQALIEQKEAMGENVLEADKLDLDSKTIARMQIVPDDSQIRSEFTGPAYLEVVDAKIIDKPMSQLQVVNMVRENLSMSPVSKVEDHDFAQIEEIAQELSRSRIESMSLAVESYGNEAKTRLVTEDAKIKLSERLSIQMTHFEKIVKSFPEGTSVQLGTAEGNLVYGVVGRIFEKNSIKGSPVASTNWRIQFLTDNRAKQITVPFSKINVSKETAIAVSERKARWDGTSIYESFDLKQTDRRSEMQLVTGNLLKAYEKFPKGKFVNFSDNQGNVRQGLIMPDDFDIHKELRKEPVAFKVPHQVKAFLTEVSSNLGVVQDIERTLTIKIQGAARYTGDEAETFVLQTPSATSVGGKYFLDTDLLDAVGGDFYSVSNRMEAIVPADRIDAVLNVLMKEKGVTLVTHDLKDLARNYLGEMLPTLELIESNQFAEQGDYVPFVPEPTKGTVEQLEALFKNEQTPEVTPAPDISQPPQISEAPSAETPSPEVSPVPVKPVPDSQQTLNSPEPPPTLSADQEKDLQFLRRWYAIADSLDRPQTYLDRIKELAQEIKEGQPLSQKAKEAMVFDGQVYQKSSAQLIDDARKILQSRGQTTETGARIFAGQIYTIASQQGTLNVRSQDRGVILEVQNQKVTMMKLRKQDFTMFQAFSQQQVQQQFRGLRH
jgi:C-terminal domain on Strawberry notch homologue/P-loop containing NTP hydrolase pore-1